MTEPVTYHRFSADSGYSWLDCSDASARAYVEGLITAADRTALTGIVHTERRQASLLARGLLRYLYEKFFARVDAEIDIRKTSAGAPWLTVASDSRPPHVSISHSHDIVAVALDSQTAIGIDVEWQKPRRDWPAIAQRAFPEVAIHSADDFHRAWCLYEAWGKANELRHIDPEANQSLMQLLASLLRDGAAPGVTEFTPAAGYRGCVYCGR